MDALPTVLIESLLGHLHAAALARAQQVNHSFRALAQAVAAIYRATAQCRAHAAPQRDARPASPSTRAASLDHGARHDMDRLLHR